MITCNGSWNSQLSEKMKFCICAYNVAELLTKLNIFNIYFQPLMNAVTSKLLSLINGSVVQCAIITLEARQSTIT